MKIDTDGKIKNNAEAYASKLAAKKLRLGNKGNTLEESTMLGVAKTLERNAEEHLTLDYIPEKGVGGELIPVNIEYPQKSPPNLKNPDCVTLDASIDRVELTQKSGVLNMALDAADAIKAQNSVEQMLAHQMAAAHRACLDLLSEAGNTKDTIEKCRLMNASARLMETYQKAMTAIAKFRNHGQQVVTVQHVQVSDGGQAVINGSVQTGG